MAFERLDIVLGVNGARKAASRVGFLNRQAKKTAVSLGGLKAALTSVFALGTVTAVTKTLDSFTNLNNRLRVVSESAEDAADKFNQLILISSRTRTSLKTNIELYARLGLTTKELGIQHDQLLASIEAVSLAAVISGSSVTEAQGAFIQLSQGLGSNELRGQELVSVLEQLPRAAQAISAELGVLNGDLRKLAEAGEITADVVIGAFINALPKLRDEFERTTPTIEQSLTVLNTAFIQFLGELGKATGVTDKISRSLLNLAGSLPDFLLKAAPTVQAIVNTFRFLAKAIEITVGRVKDALVDLTDSSNFEDFTNKTESNFKSFTKKFIADTKKFADDFVIAMQVAFGGGFVSREDILASRQNEGGVFELSGSQRRAANLLGIDEEGIKKIEFFMTELNNSFDGYVDQLKEAQKEAFSLTDVSDNLANAVQKIKEANLDVIDSAKAPGPRTVLSRKELQELSGALRDFVGELFPAIEAQRQFTDLQNQLFTAAASDAPEFRELREELASFGFTLDDVMVRFKEANAEFFSANFRLKEQLDSFNDTTLTEMITLLREAEQAFADNPDDMAAMSGAIVNLRKEIIDLSSRTIDGAVRGFRRLTDEYTDGAVQVEGVITNAFRGAEDALVSFVTTGKFEFRELIDSIISDLARLAIQQAILAPITRALGGSLLPSSSIAGSAAPSAAAITSGAASFSTPPSAQSISMPISVTVDASGANNPNDVGTEVAKQVQKSVEQSVRGLVRDEMGRNLRTGGTFNNPLRQGI